MLGDDFKRYYLDADSAVLCTIMGVNGIPILSDPAGEGRRAIYPINEWLKPGENTITLYAAWPEEKPFVPATGRVSLRVFESKPAAPSPAPGVVCGASRWPLPPAPEVYPFQAAVPFTVTAAPPTQLWQEAEVVEELEPADRQAILALVERLRLALMRSDFEAAITLLAYRYDDLARANNGDPDRLRQIAVKQYTRMMAEPLPRSTALADEEVLLTLAAAGQVVHVGRPQGKDAILLSTEDSEYAIPVYAARITGRWRLVR